MDHSTPTVAALLLAASLSAQNLSVVFDSAGGALSATAGVQTQTTQIPVGPLGPLGALSAAAGGSTNSSLTSFSWNSYGSEAVQELTLTASCFVAGSASASLTPLDVVVMLSHPTPVGVSLDVTAFRSAPAGTATPTLRMDVLDDGSFELTELMQPTLSTFVQLGPTPVPIRCQLGLELAVPGASLATFTLNLRPADTLVNQLASGCTTAPFQVTPRFDGGLEYGTNNVLAGSMFAVFGLQTQPIYLGNYAWPNSSIVMPCSLVPSPDLVTFLSPTSYTHVLPIPAAVRPITLYSQAVWLAPGAITTTDASLITAY